MTHRWCSRRFWRRAAVCLLVALTPATSSCGWHGLNSLALPGTAGRGPGAYDIQAQMPDITNIQPNSRVRVGDVTVGNVVKIERQGWHALVTMRLDADVHLPANATAKVGQTSLLGSLHVELAPPAGVPPKGTLAKGSLIPLSSAGSYPTTEQTLAAVSVLLNGGGLSQVQDITKALSTAFAGGRGDDLRHLLGQLNEFSGRLNAQTDDIIRVTGSLNNFIGQFAAQRPVLDQAFRTIPQAVGVLNEQRDKLIEALDQLGKFAALAANAVGKTKESLVKELQDLGPVVESLANAGPSLTRSLSFFTTFPFPTDTLTNWLRGDYGNQTDILDITLSRLDAALFTGTRWEGNLTELEMQWGRTISQVPSPFTSGNPLTLPYHFVQGN